MKTYVIALASMLAASTCLPTVAGAIVGSGARPVEMAARSTTHPIDQIGCYRLGLSGYHRYHSCIGPRFMYPHHRICHHHHCYYR
jgi:hypothetical protein